ncbi:MAG: glycosyltransferase family 2 protein [Clostridia bacterium]|nr:glycosyltransferase family 2 protein [Clostridia bacterium]
MQFRPLPAGDNANKNKKLLSLLGEGGFSVCKTCFGLIRHPHEKGAQLGRLSALDGIAKNAPDGLPFDRAEWKKRFRRLLLTTNGPRAATLMESFYEDRLVPVKRADGAVPDAPAAGLDPNTPIVLFAVKNDLVRVKELFGHYRKLGVQRFAVIDNGSDDGTLEFLSEQPDADVYRTDARFSSIRKAGWLNRLAAFYGTERWYLWLDADELFTYAGAETRSLTELTHALERRGETKLRSFMLDMYPEGVLLDAERRDADFLTDCVWFDPDSEDYMLRPEIMRMSGGMRQRVFGLEEGTLSKVTLLHFGNGRMLTGAHTIAPQAEDYSGDFMGVLMHYKFLPGDLKKYRRIVDDGTYTNGSAEYKRYLKVFSENPMLTAKNNGSRRYTGSASLSDAFPFLKDPFEDRKTE